MGRSEHYNLINSDILEWCASYNGKPFMACLCDAPYELAFMNKEWDNTGVAMKPETWEALARHLLPGAFLLAFAGTLNDDMISLAMRQAGLVKHHSLYWIHGQGFPKSTRILPGEYEDGETVKRAGKECAVNGAFAGDHPERVPASELAKRFAEHRYGRQSLKPATEVILCFQKSYSGRPVDCITETGAGALNIGAGRIGTGERWMRNNQAQVHGKGLAFNTSGGYVENDPAGRWPANLLIESGAVAEALDAQSGVSSERRDSKLNHGSNGNIVYTNHKAGQHTPSYPGEGGASRFFFRSDFLAEEQEPYFYTCDCFLCSLLSPSKMGYNDREFGSQPTKETLSCQQNLDRESVLTAESSSNPTGAGKLTALRSVQEKPLPENEDSNPKANTSVPAARKPSSPIEAIIPFTVLKSARAMTSESLLRNVKSVGNLCDCAAIVFAQSLARMLQGHDSELLPGLDFISERRKQTLIQSLALFVESRENTDTTPTIASLKMWFGYAQTAIENCIRQESEEARTESDPTSPHVLSEVPFRYVAKAGRAERDAGLGGMPAHKIMGGDLGLTQRMENGAITHARTAEPVRNSHPTIKPLRLMRYLASLLLPPTEYAPRRLLVPFAGVASEMIGAYLAGWEQVIGIEQSAEYVSIGEARLRFWQGNVGLFDSLTADEDEDESPPVQTGLEF